MTRKQGTTSVIDVKALLAADGDYLRAMVRAVVEATLEAEMTAALAETGERSEARLGYRSGYSTRTLITRVGTLELRVPQDREGGSRPGCSSAPSGRRRRWSEPWRRCTCRGSRRAR